MLTRLTPPISQIGHMLKRFSDLDLAVEAQLTWPQPTARAHAFDESLLPIKVDIVELDWIDMAFRERIAKDFIAATCKSPQSA
jgi:predicted nucleotidyltransferase